MPPRCSTACSHTPSWPEPRQFPAFAGITARQFDFLCAKIARQHAVDEARKLSGRKGRRAVGAGRPFKIDPREGRILMLPVHCRCYVTDDMCRYLFGADGSNAYRGVVANVEHAVRRCLPIPARCTALQGRPAASGSCSQCSRGRWPSPTSQGSPFRGPGTKGGGFPGVDPLPPYKKPKASPGQTSDAWEYIPCRISGGLS